MEISNSSRIKEKVIGKERSLPYPFDELWILLKSKSLYIGIIILIFGIQTNFLSQSYLNEYVNSGKSLPTLSDLILDNIPLWDIDYIYDITSIISVVILGIYIFHKKRIEVIPYVLLLCGVFHIVRAVFIVLTPLGNPPYFDGTEGLFGGFSKFEFGVYPSGHTGISFIYFLMANGKIYRGLLFICVLTIIGALLLSRGHYSIDILSGILFAYAIKSFGDKHLNHLSNNRFVYP